MSEQGPVRRRVAEPKQSTEGRTGCIAAGAVFGIVAGILFTLFALPPIVSHFFEEAKVRVGEAYEGDAKVIRVESVSWGSEGESRHRVILRVKTNKTWRPKPSDFQLELDDGKRIKSAGPDPAVIDSGLDFELGVERTLTLLFIRPPGLRDAPAFLHITDPAVRFELPPVVVRLVSSADREALIERAGRSFALDSWDQYLAGRDGITRMLSLMLIVTSDVAWDPPTTNFVLELEDGQRLEALAPIEKMPVTWPHFEPGQPRKLNLLFACPPGQTSRPVRLHVADPGVTLDLPAASSR